jgi:hypothetical protein
MNMFMGNLACILTESKIPVVTSVKIKWTMSYCHRGNEWSRGQRESLCYGFDSHRTLLNKDDDLMYIRRGMH